MNTIKSIILPILATGCFAISGLSDAAVVVDQIGADDGVYDLYNLDSQGIDIANYFHNYDLSGLASITAATYEIEIVGPGGAGDSPLEIYIDNNFLGSSTERSNTVLFTFDLLDLGLGALIDGDNTIKLQAYTFNTIEVDFSRITIEGPAVPLPAAFWLFISGLAGLAGISGRRLMAS